MKLLRFVLLATLAASSICSVAALGADPIQQSDVAPITYTNLDEALAALHAKPGVTFRNQDGWIVAEDTRANTTWLLTPPGHPAYPSVVKRTLVNGSKGSYFDTAVRCWASQDRCDKYFGSK